MTPRERGYLATMDDLIGVSALDAWFADRLHGLQYSAETIAYVAGVLKALSRPSDEDVFANRSIVLAYRDAVATGSFTEFQRIGDWVLWAQVVVPEHVAPHRELVQSIGRLSYYTCHRILMGKWRVYEELADELPTLARHVRHRLV